MNFLKRTTMPAVLAVSIWFAGYVVFLGTIMMATPKQTDEVTDAIVVLTGGQMRIETGLELFASGRARHLFITGVHPKVSKQEIKDMWTGDIPLPPCCITLGHNADTTVQNAEETQTWLADKGYSSIRLVTANFHMNRSLIELKHSLPGIEIIPHPVVQPNLTPSKMRFWQLSFIEYHKTIFRQITLLFTPRPGVHV